MTCTIGIISNGSIYMGADDRTTSYYSYYSRKDPKVFKVEDKLLIGWCGTCRIALLEHCLILPKQDSSHSVSKYMYNSLVPTIQEILGRHGCLKNESGMQSFDGAMLLGYKGHLYKLYTDFSLEQVADRNYVAIGSGCEYAEGCLYKQVQTMEPTDRIKEAIDCAAAFCTGVGQTNTILKL